MSALRFFGHRLTFASLLAAGALMCPVLTLTAQTQITDLKVRLAPGAMQTDTFAFQDYWGGTDAQAVIRANSDSSDNMHVSNYTFSQMTDFHYFPNADSLNAGQAPSFWDLPAGLWLFTTPDNPNTSYWHVTYLTNSEMRAVNEDPNSKADSMDVFNHQKMMYVFANDSAKSRMNDFSNVTISWDNLTADSNFWGNLALKTKFSVSMPVDSSVSVAAGDSEKVGPQSYVANRRRDDDVQGEIFIQGPKTYRINPNQDKSDYTKDTAMGSTLCGIFSFSNDSTQNSGVWSQMMTPDGYTIYLAREFLMPITLDQNTANRAFYLGKNNNATYGPGTPGVDTMLYPAQAGFGLRLNPGLGNSYISWNLLSKNGNPHYEFTANHNGSRSDTGILVELNPSGSSYVISDSSMEVETYETSISFFVPKITDVNGITYTISKNRDTIYEDEGPHILAGLGSALYAQQAPWEPTPLPQAVQLLLPTNGTKLTGAQPVRLVWSSLGTTANRYHLHLAAPNFALDTAIVDTSLVVAVDTGAYSWTVTGENKEGEGPASAAFTFTVAPQAGVELSSPASAGDIYPNPTTGTVTVLLTRASSRLELYDMLGRAVRVFAGGHSGKITFSIADLPPGTYTLRDLTNGGYWMIVKE